VLWQTSLLCQSTTALASTRPYAKGRDEEQWNKPVFPHHPYFAVLLFDMFVTLCYGKRGNCEKSGLRFSRKAFLPSFPSSVM
jgi:hypothetical protein